MQLAPWAMPEQGSANIDPVQSCYHGRLPAACKSAGPHGAAPWQHARTHLPSSPRPFRFIIFFFNPSAFSGCFLGLPLFFFSSEPSGSGTLRGLPRFFFSGTCPSGSGTLCGLPRFFFSGTCPSSSGTLRGLPRFLGWGSNGACNGCSCCGSAGN